jgi:pimeloyl-ACP methyl ester carboxylesterase
LNTEDEIVEDDELIARLKECPAKLEADLRFYTTDIAMQDLDHVRALLGYETINLFGTSYGTRAALVYLKMYPAHVRSVVLDAVVDPSFVIYQDAAQDGQQALELFFKRCEADEACSSTYPDLRSEFEALSAVLEEMPAEVTLPHPITGESLQFTVTQTALANIVSRLCARPGGNAALSHSPGVYRGELCALDHAGIYGGCGDLRWHVLCRRVYGGRTLPFPS